jgi:hypothetical protein
MAESKCSKCQSLTFEAKSYTLPNVNEEVLFIQCAGCGSVVGAVNTFGVADAVQSNHEILSKIEAALKVRERHDPRPPIL